MLHPAPVALNKAEDCRSLQAEFFFYVISSSTILGGGPTPGLAHFICPLGFAMNALFNTSHTLLLVSLFMFCGAVASICVYLLYAYLFFRLYLILSYNFSRWI